MSKPQGNPFWQWSLDVYERAGVKNRLIYLQDDFGFDVNITLWCCWRACDGETLSEDAVRSAEKACGQWVDGVIEYLREARINARNGPPALYQQIKEAELAAEHHEQDILYGLSAGFLAKIEREEAMALAKSNLSLYASLIDAPRRAGYSSTLLRDLIDHIFNSGDAGQTGKADRNTA